ncbi:MAG: hypothetical protein EAZ57_03895 [Cytophagales bacterium]|nr:MAG: hypothetical protein EAZ67_04910 [Cytophagales bacterium]TAF61353.1 MAG: hypothetical protein EAZ57_03895 [Cytophagales bacterium]
MSKLLTGNTLNAAISEIIAQAESKLVLLSPRIHLHHRILDLLKAKIIYPELETMVVFGEKNRNYQKNFRPEDLNFFKTFPNIEIRHEPRLSVCYYANEKEAVMTSMTLTAEEHDNSIDTGVMLKSNLLNNIFGESLDTQAYDFFNKVIENSELLYKNAPKYNKTLLGKKYQGSQVELDKIPVSNNLFDD